MFKSLTDKLSQTLRDLAGKSRLTPENVEAACKDVRTALLEADVNFKVVKKFVDRVREKTMGAEVAPDMEPAHAFIKAVSDELVAVMGGKAEPLAVSGKPPTVLMMIGLQGSGKTTTAGKLARLLAKDQKRLMLVACDLQRPAAVDQLETLAKQVGVKFYANRGTQDPVLVAKEGLSAARAEAIDTVIFDTAGRLHVDEALMQQLEAVKATVQPHEVLLVVDAMTGQDAVKVAETFDKRLAVTGVILTKLDGDTRGGAALSIREVTGKPIKFAGMGEKLDMLQPFHPDRMASRILNMGDVLTLVEKAQSTYSEDEMQAMQKRMFAGNWNLQDFLNQLQAVKRMGPLGELFKMIPGVSAMMGDVGDAELEQGVDEMRRKEALILSMTQKERLDPEVINASRRQRIARGAGQNVAQVNALLREWRQMKTMMQQMKGMMKSLEKGKMPKGLPPMGPGMKGFRPRS